MALGVRGSNPIWFEVDLTANPFDDTFYLFVLENTIPYIPAVVYHDPELNTPWTNPIRFLSNGTLPNDIFFEQDRVYRLEFRQGDTQNDPLIYLVENYRASGSGSGPINDDSLTSDNQITNPQFSLINFSSPYEIPSTSNPDPIQVAPGWFLELTGTGTATITQEPLNNATSNPSNAPYALRLQLSGWDADGVFLVQRFEQNGNLWAGKTVSCAVTTRLQGAPQSISATLVDSNATVLAQVLFPQPVTELFSELTGHGTLGAASNPDVPPAAYVDFRVALPSAVDIYLTSFQLVVQAATDLSEPSFEQDTIERQVDHTFHYYKDSILIQPKDSVLTGWVFPQNPWQFTTTASTTVANQCEYIADQTILYQLSGASQVASGKGSAATGYGLQIQAVTATNRFAIIQYVAPQTMATYWNYLMSALAKIRLITSNGTVCRVKMRLIYSTSLPPTIGATEPIASWSATAGSNPVFQAGWTEIVPRNDPVYTLGDGSIPFKFESFELPAASTDTMTLGIVLYTLDNLDETGTADIISFDEVSLVPNEFACPSTVLTFDETLARCQFYFEKSKEQGVLSTTAGGESALSRPMRATASGFIGLLGNPFGIEYLRIKNIVPVTRLYSEAGTLDNVTGRTAIGGSGIITGPSDIADTSWQPLNAGQKGISYYSNTATIFIHSGSVATSQFGEAWISFHYEADARLGL